MPFSSVSICELEQVNVSWENKYGNCCQFLKHFLAVYFNPESSRTLYKLKGMQLSGFLSFQDINI